MHILALKAKGRVLPHIHEAMVKGFRNLGKEVDNISISEEGDDFSLVGEKLKRSYRAVFTLNMGGEQNFLRRIREWQTKHRQLWIIWFVDDPEGYNFPQACEPSYTLAFCWDRGLIEEISPSLRASGFSLLHLPLATDPEIFFPNKTRDRYSGPGIFVGNVSHPNEVFARISEENLELQSEIEKIWEIYRQDFSISLHDLLWNILALKVHQEKSILRLNWLARLWVKVCAFQLAIRKRQEVVAKVLRDQDALYGDENWRQILRKGIYQGQIEYGKELNEVYNKAAFVLDLRPGQSRTGITQRIFDASACGIPVLTEWSPELESLFEPQGELYCFRNLGEAEQMRDLIISDMEKARKKAQKVRDRVLANHTYHNRARYILEYLRKF